MAQYRRPVDPRDSKSDSNPPPINRRGRGNREPIPWFWLGLGIIVTIIGVLAAVAFVSLVLVREPLAVDLPTPTIIRLTAPPTLLPSSTAPSATVSPIPTFTPPPTPDRSVVPEEVTIGFYAEVANTDGLGVSLRSGPSTDNLRVQLLPEGTTVLVVGGPDEGSGFLWWQIRLDDGNEGWVASDFLFPAIEPAATEGS